MQELTHFSLCSGIGGLDLAAEWAGFKTVAQCEIDDYASKVLAKNFKGVPNLNDIRTVTTGRLRELGINPAAITVMSAGFPCQPYSLAGKGLGDSDCRDLWGEVARVLGDVKPKWFVGENTPGLFARENQRYFRRVLNDLTALGYSVGWGIWGACDVGAPHKRDRVFIVGRNTHSVRKQKKCAIKERQDSESCGTCRNIPHAISKPTRGLSLGEEPSYSVFGKLCNAISDSDSERELQSQGREQNERGRFRNVCEEIPNAVSKRENKGRQEPDGFKRYSWWQTEPDVGRVANGVPSRVDRLRCNGNAVVPYQALPIFEAIAEIEQLIYLGEGNAT